MRFSKEDSGLYYNEWYGSVTWRVKVTIQKAKWSPADYDDAVRRHGGSMLSLDAHLRKVGVEYAD